MSIPGHEPRRIQCANPDQHRRESFVLRPVNGGLYIDTPGALTRTRWNREQAVRLRDALTAYLNTGSPS